MKFCQWALLVLNTCHQCAPLDIILSFNSQGRRFEQLAYFFIQKITLPIEVIDALLCKSFFIFKKLILLLSNNAWNWSKMTVNNVYIKIFQINAVLLYFCYFYYFCYVLICIYYTIFKIILYTEPLNVEGRENSDPTHTHTCMNACWLK